MRHIEGHSDFPSKEDIGSNPDLAPVGHDLDSPIDYEKLRAEIMEFGPIEMTQAANRLKIILNISECEICDKPCGSDVITLVQISGSTTLTTLIDQGDLLAAKSLNAFFKDFIHNPFAYFCASLVEA
jgi:hypothetical protein